MPKIYVQMLFVCCCHLRKLAATKTGGINRKGIHSKTHLDFTNTMQYVLQVPIIIEAWCYKCTTHVRTLCRLTFFWREWRHLWQLEYTVKLIVEMDLVSCYKSSLYPSVFGIVLHFRDKECLKRGDYDVFVGTEITSGACSPQEHSLRDLFLKGDHRWCVDSDTTCHCHSCIQQTKMCYGKWWCRNGDISDYYVSDVSLSWCVIRNKIVLPFRQR